MKTYLKNNLKQVILVLEGEIVKDDFQIFMLQENAIRGLLKTSIKYVDDTSHYQYDISGKVSLEAKYQKEKLSNEDMRHIIDALLATLKEVQKHMLDVKGILLAPEYIFCEGEKYFFCYYPPNQLVLTEEFHKLTEFFVREVNYKDKEGIHLAYTLHKSSMEENYSIEKIMDEVLNEEMPSVVRYEDRIEEKKEEAIAIAEKKELWEPVKRLLDRRKKEKWGRWGELQTEESDL